MTAPEVSKPLLKAFLSHRYAATEVNLYFFDTSR